MTHSMPSAHKPKHRQLSFEAIGTQWWIEYHCDDDLSLIIHDRITAFDATYSRFRDDSWVCRVARAAGSYAMPDDGYPLFRFYQDLYNITDGAVSPLVGQTLVDAGYDSSYSLKFKRRTTAPRMKNTVIFDHNNLSINQPLLFDFGAAGKGYLVDLIAELLQSRGVRSATLNAGGDIRHIADGSLPISIGLQHPTDTNLAIGTVKLSDKSLCGSSTQLRAWGDMHHIVDPRTGLPVDHIVATWVVADIAMLADGIATALFFVDPLRLLNNYSFSYAILYRDFSLSYSDDFPGEFY